MALGSLHQLDPEHSIAYMREVPVAALPSPRPARGPFAWMRRNLFATPLDGALTIAVTLFLLWIIPPLLNFLLFEATWSGAGREACTATPARPDAGACWPFVAERLGYFTYGAYPISERWRVDAFFVMLAFGIVWLLKQNAPRRDLGAWYFFVVVPVVSFVLLNGWPMLGLSRVDTSLWGGILVTIVVSAVGILLALGRRSRMPVIRLVSIIFIEFVRGVPLITVLFMASVMLPLFVSEAWSPDKLIRALVGIAMFASAYMAEVVRAGLQAVPKGQYEGAMALGLSYSKMMRLIVLPQALTVTIPNIVNTYIGLFKDTTLVFIVGIFDLLKTIEAARIDPRWATPVTSTTGYAFAAIFYFVFCSMMSRYAKTVEARLARGKTR